MKSSITEDRKMQRLIGYVDSEVLTKLVISGRQVCIAGILEEVLPYKFIKMSDIELVTPQGEQEVNALILNDFLKAPFVGEKKAIRKILARDGTKYKREIYGNVWIDGRYNETYFGNIYRILELQFGSEIVRREFDKAGTLRRFVEGEMERASKKELN